MLWRLWNYISYLGRFKQQPYRKCIDIVFVETIIDRLSAEKQVFELELRLWHPGWFGGGQKQ